MLKRLIAKLKKSTPAPQAGTARILNRDQHRISRTNISDAALKVLYRLHKANYDAYLVGGGVRDMLLGMEPKDFDVATNAHPEEVRRLFKNSRVVGRRFKLAHVIFGREMIEVATFRGHHDNAEDDNESRKSDTGMLLRDNVYGTIDEDAARRDFTVNALYYNIADFSVHSYEGGMEDLQNRRLRLIGDPETRYKEDPVRMLRAARFAAKLDFTVDKASATPIPRLASLLRNIPASRLFEETLKLFLSGHALASYQQLQQFGLFAELFPQTHGALKASPAYEELLKRAFINSDERIAQGKTLTPAFLYAVLLWPAVQEQMKQLMAQGMPGVPAQHSAASTVIESQLARTGIPKRFVIPMREIWDAQRRLIRRMPKQIEGIYAHPRFRAAYDFLLLREHVGEDVEDAGSWWTRYQQQNPDDQQVLVSQLQRPSERSSKPKRPRRRSNNKPRNE